LGTAGLLPFEHSRHIPLLHTEQVRERIRTENIEGDKHDKDTNVPPTVRVPDVEIVVEEFIRRAVRAKLALRGRAGVRNVSSLGGDVRSEVLGTPLTRGWIDIRVLDTGTVDLLSADN